MSYPSLPLFPGAYFGDTKHLDCEQHGAYLQLLMIAWQSPTCSVPDDDAKIARMVSLPLRRWLSIKPTVMAFWSLTEAGWVQARLLKERAWVQNTIEKRRAAGRLGGRPKLLKTNEPAKAKGLANGKQPTPTPTPTHIEEREAASAASAGAREAPPDRKRFDEVERTCRDALGDLAPVDLVIGPVVKLLDAHGPPVAIPALLDVARSSRNPIRTWRLLATIAGERLAAPAIQPVSGARHHETNRKPTISDLARADLYRIEREEAAGPVLRLASG